MSGVNNAIRINKNSTVTMVSNNERSIKQIIFKDSLITNNISIPLGYMLGLLMIDLLMLNKAGFYVHFGVMVFEDAYLIM